MTHPKTTQTRLRRFKESTTIKSPDPTIVDIMYEDQELVYETMRVLSDHPNVLDDLLLVEQLHVLGIYEDVLKQVLNYQKGVVK